MTFQHEADYGGVALHHLLQHGAGHVRLRLRPFVGVGVAAIHHDGRLQAGLLQFAFASADAVPVVIGALGAAAQDDVGVGIAPGPDDGHLPGRVDAQKAMRLRHRAHGVDGGA